MSDGSGNLDLKISTLSNEDEKNNTLINSLRNNTLGADSVRYNYTDNKFTLGITYGNNNKSYANVGEKLYQHPQNTFADFASIKVPISANQKLIISTRGGGNARGYYITDVDFKVTEVANSGAITTGQNKEITATQDGFLIAQTATSVTSDLPNIFIELGEVLGFGDSIDNLSNTLFGDTDNVEYPIAEWNKEAIYGNKEYISSYPQGDISTSVYNSIALKNINGRKIKIYGYGGTQTFPLYIFADKNDKLISISEPNLNTFDNGLDVDIPFNVYSVYVNSKLDTTHTKEDVKVVVLSSKPLNEEIEEKFDKKLEEKQLVVDTIKTLIDEEYGKIDIKNLLGNGSIGGNGEYNPAATDYFHVLIKKPKGRFIELDQKCFRVCYFKGDTVSAENMLSVTNGNRNSIGPTIPILDNKELTFIGISFYNVDGSFNDIEYINILKQDTTIYNNKIVKSRLFGKNIVWVGTSIPARDYLADDGVRYSYPLLVGRRLGATVYNESVGESGCRAGIKSSITEDDPNGWLGLGTIQSTKNLSLTISEMQQAAIKNGTTATGNNSYEYKLIQKYFDEGSDRFLCMADYLIFNHGRNDWKGGADAEIFDQIPEDLYDKTTFIGSVNYVIKECLRYNSKLKIMFIGHYRKEDSGDQAEKNQKVDSALQQLAKLWNAPYCRLYEMSNMSDMKIITAGYWSRDPEQSSEWIWNETGYSGGTHEMTQYAMWNPPTDDSQTRVDVHCNYKGIPHLADIIADWMISQ